MKDIEHEVVNLLKEKNYHISFAESCTGGLAAARLINVANVSHVLDASVVTYANEAKIKYLGVKEESINKYGVVSEEVAKEMALGVAENNNAQVGVGITGIAGPSGAVPGKPVGTVCFGFSIEGEVSTYTMHFGNPGRNEVRQMSVNFVYQKLYDLLENKIEK